MTPEEAIKELETEVALYDNDIVRLDAFKGTGDRNLIDALEMAIEALKEKANNPWHDLIANPDDLPKIACEAMCGKSFYMLNQEMLITCKTESRKPWVRKGKLLYEDGTFEPCEGKKTAWFGCGKVDNNMKIYKLFGENIQVTAWKFVNFYTEKPFMGVE